MNTSFSYYDINKVLRRGELIFSCEFNNTKFIVYKKEKSDDEYDVLYVSAYEEIDGKLYIADATKDEVDVIKNQISLILRSI